MKKCKRFLAMLLSVITLTAVMAVAVSAANTDDTPFNFYARVGIFGLVDCREKQDTSAVYFYAYDGLASVQVQIYGSNTNKEGDGENLTVADGRNVGYVTCIKGIDYSVHSDVREEGYARAALYVASNTGNAGIVSGEWSPDSMYAHRDAT